jgi:hypothetical protein
MKDRSMPAQNLFELEELCRSYRIRREDPMTWLEAVTSRRGWYNWGQLWMVYSDRRFSDGKLSFLRKSGCYLFMVSKSVVSSDNGIRHPVVVVVASVSLILQNFGRSRELAFSSVVLPSRLLFQE